MILFLLLLNFLWPFTEGELFLQVSYSLADSLFASADDRACVEFILQLVSSSPASISATIIRLVKTAEPTNEDKGEVRAVVDLNELHNTIGAGNRGDVSSNRFITNF